MYFDDIMKIIISHFHGTIIISKKFFTEVHKKNRKDKRVCVKVSFIGIIIKEIGFQDAFKGF